MCPPELLGPTARHDARTLETHPVAALSRRMIHRDPQNHPLCQGVTHGSFEADARAANEDTTRQRPHGA
jgi:hypothetical protein